MARHERDFRPSAEGPLGPEELRALPGGQGKGLTRTDAMAWYLSASEGWILAGGLLGGAFAEGAQRLRERKAD